MKKYHKQSGFTLIELLISATVFAVVLTMGAALFISITNSQQKSINEAKVLRDARQAMESIARVARMNPVHYTGYGVGGIPDGPTSELIMNENGEIVTYRLESGQVIRETATDSQPLTSDDVTFNSLDFWISPRDPSTYSTHPQTVMISLEAERPDIQGRADVLRLETTVTSRAYGGFGGLVAP